MIFFRLFARFWRWLLIGPPLVTEPRVEADPAQLSIRMPDRVADRAEAIAALCVGWTLITLVGSALLGTTIHNYSLVDRRAEAVGAVLSLLAAMISGYALVLSKLRERRHDRLRVTDRTIEAQQHREYFRPHPPDVVALDVRVVRRLFREGDAVKAETATRSARVLATGCTPAEGRWLLRLVVEHLQRVGLVRWSWESEDAAVIDKFLPPDHPRWPVERVGDGVRIAVTPVEASPVAVVRKKLASRLWWGKLAAGVGLAGWVLTGPVAVAFGPFNLAQLAVVPALLGQAGLIAGGILFLSAWETYGKLPAARKEAATVTVEVMADAGRLMRVDGNGDWTVWRADEMSGLTVCHAGGEDEESFTAALLVKRPNGATERLFGTDPAGAVHPEGVVAELEWLARALQESVDAPTPATSEAIRPAGPSPRPLLTSRPLDQR